MKNRIHTKLLDHCDKLADWYQSRLEGTYVPFYASFDIRDAGFKIGNVDGNIFPAGFNNICTADKEYAPEVMTEYLQKYYPETRKILLLAESHLKNTYYWENAITISELLIEAGYDVQVGMISDEIGMGTTMESFSGRKIQVEAIQFDEGRLRTSSMEPDLVISNNDFSTSYNDVDFARTQMTPWRELGWYQRQKINYFNHYNQFAQEFAQFIDEDPWLFQVATVSHRHFDINDEQSRHQLATAVDQMVGEIGEKYDQHGIDIDPYVFIKNNSGTYGLGVIEASSGKDVEAWNYKSKKKMKASKGGGGISHVIIQEGIPSVLTEDSATAEPVVYMVGDELVGGFLRTHEKKSAQQSLNSPGAVYKRLCLSDLKVSAEGCLLENVYGWVAKLGLLAIVQEAQSLRTDSRS
jgi:glutamate--cysteine ligase